MAHLPADAFSQYVAMGAGRTYVGLARALGVSKRTVVRRAKAEGWQHKLVHVEGEARRKAEERAVEDVAAVDAKHLRMARAIQARALTALQGAPLGNGAAAVRALDVAIKIERAILGRDQPTPPGVTSWTEIVSRIEQRRAERAAKPPEAPPVQAAAEPVVPAVIAARTFGEN